MRYYPDVFPYVNFAYWGCLLITFANSLDQDEERQNVGPNQEALRHTDGIPERIFRKS